MFDELYEAMLEVEEHSEHDGYLYKVNEVLIVLVMGLFCGLESILMVFLRAKNIYINLPLHKALLFY